MMKSNKHPTPTAVFGANIILRHLDALVIEIPGVRLAEDIEFIHRMRVASRRLRNALPIFAPVLRTKKIDFWAREIRNITRALGAARDLDVQIDSLEKFIKSKKISSHFIPGIRRLILRLNQKRKVLQEDVISSLDHFETSNTSIRMHQFLDPYATLWDENLPAHAELYHLAHQVISTRLFEFFQRDSAIHNPENILELHAQRISAKHLRYTLELFSQFFVSDLRPYLNTCRKFQDQLGSIHDCDVWLSLLPAFMHEELTRTIEYYGKPDPYNLLAQGLTEFEKSRKEMRLSLYSDFISDWDAVQTKGLWKQLQTEISVPLVTYEVYPPLK